MTASGSGLGKILVNPAGRTLYETTATGTAAACTGSCSVRWHPLLIPAGAKPVAGSGVKPALLGTAKRADGRVQVTYGGRALYVFTGDTKAGSAAGQNLGGVWHAIAPSGRAVLASVAAGSSTDMPSGSQASSGTGTSTSTDPSMGTGTTPATSTTAGGIANPGMWCAANPKSCVNGVPITGSG